MTNKNQKDRLIQENSKGYTAKVIAGEEPCDEKCVDWPRDPKDHSKRCSYCNPESLLANQKRVKE